jgi:hypothetical protein
MSFQYGSLRCAGCGMVFAFTATEQEVLASGCSHKDPERRPQCPAIRKTRRNGDGDRSHLSRSWK